MPITFTFTGVDDATDASDLRAIAAEFPGTVEFACLIGRERVVGRFPTLTKVAEMLRLWPSWGTSPFWPKIAVHLCGPVARAVRMDESHEAITSEMVSQASRIQVNATEYGMADVFAIRRRFSQNAVIQWREQFPRNIGLDLLFDCSGGRGVCPRWYPTHPPANCFYRHGFAGGIGPDNVLEVLDKLGKGDYWLDMESKVRTNDRFDVDLVWKVLTLAKEGGWL